MRSPSCADATFNSDCDKFMRCRMLRFVWGRRAICVLFRSLGLRSACNIFVVRVARSHWDLFFLFFYLSSVSMGEKPVKISKHCFVGFACAS